MFCISVLQDFPDNVQILSVSPTSLHWHKSQLQTAAIEAVTYATENVYSDILIWKFAIEIYAKGLNTNIIFQLGPCHCLKHKLKIPSKTHFRTTLRDHVKMGQVELLDKPLKRLLNNLDD